MRVIRGGGCDGKDKRGGDHRPKRDRRRAAAPALGVWVGGGDLHFRSFARGVSVLQPLIGSLVECCSVLTSGFLSQHRNIVR